MTKTEVALQLTLKAIDRLKIGMGQTTIEGCGKEVAQLFNAIASNLQLPDAVPETLTDAARQALRQATLFTESSDE